MQRDFPSSSDSWIRYHVRGSGDRNLSTSWSSLAGSTGNILSRPEVGGAISGNVANVVYQSDLGPFNSGDSRVPAHVLNVATSTVGPVIDLQSGGGLDRETPSVNQVSLGGASASWIVCWTQIDRSINDDDWDLIVRRIDSTGTTQGHDFFANAADTVPAFQPKVAGRDGRYMVSYGESTNTPGNRRVRAPSSGTRFWSSSIAFDYNTLRHWAVTYYSDPWSVLTERVGHDAGVCESATVWSNIAVGRGHSPAITFNASANDFPLVFTTTQGGSQSHPVYGVRFTYVQFSNPIVFGIGCGPATLSSNANAHSRKPHSGSQFFAITAHAVPTNAVEAMNIGLQPTSIPIPILPGCFSNTTPVVTLPMNATGDSARLLLWIPSRIVGELFL